MRVEDREKTQHSELCTQHLAVHGGTKMKAEDLVRMAVEAMGHAYVPYSGYKVGAALLCADGTVYCGCNIENAAYGPTNCAERTAFFKAVSEGVREFRAIAIIGGSVATADGDGAVPKYCAPCGVCRQVMREFCDADEFEIILAKSGSEYKTCRLADLFPDSFGPENLD